MKKSDIAMIVLIAGISVIGSYFIVGAIPALKKAGEPVSVRTIEEYNSELEEINRDIFNSKAINPTVEVSFGTGD